MVDSNVIMVDSNVTTITLNGNEIKVEFGSDHSYYQITNKGDTDIYASMSPNITPEADGVYTVSAGGSEIIGDGYPFGAFYLLGTGKVYIRGKRDAMSASFKPAAKGGEKPSGTGEHYAFAVNQNVSVPGSMITYPTGYDNSDFTPAYMNYTTGEFDYGSWGDAFFLKKLKVVMLNFDGTEAYEIDPNDYTKKKDGTDVGTEGNVMVAVPKIYYKVSDNKNGTAIIHVSDTKLNDDYHCYAHIGINGGEKDYCYMAVYDGCYVDNKLRSLTGQAPMGSQTAEEEVGRALANNPNPDNKNWYTGVAADRLLLQILLMMISKTTNSQTAFGYGFAKENSAAISSGTMDTKGLFWGETTGKHGVKVFGIENFWGNVWKRIGGWINDHGAQKLKMTYGTQDGSATIGYNFDGAGYVQINTCPVDGYIKGMSFVPFGLIPSATGGNMTSYFTDQFWNVKSQNNYGMVGGTYYTEEPAGMFYVSLNRPTSDMAINFGASLSYKL